MKKNIGYIDISDHPLTMLLEKNWQTILSEFNELAKTGLNKKVNNIMGGIVNQEESNGKMLYAGTITSIFTRLVEESCSPGEYFAAWGNTEESKAKGDLKYKARQALTPKLEEILNEFHPYVGSVGFNMMLPGTALSKHYGMSDKYIRFHLGLICDPGATFLVNDLPPRPWVEGKVWAFDDGSSFHGTQHNGTSARLILIVDLDREAINTIREEIVNQHV